jgi:molybdopterin molybdotransferase
MDGYGVRAADVFGARPKAPAMLHLAGTIRAGATPGPALRPGRAVKIFTGAPVPRGVDAIVMREHCREADGFVLVGRAARRGDHLRRKGEEFRRGQSILPAGTRLTPPVIALLASLGYTRVRVHRPPRVSVVVTGDEVAPPGRRLRPGQVYECNAPAISDALRRLGVHEPAVFQARDDPGQLRRTLSRALRQSDVVITVGGVSVGEFDLVKTAAESVGVQRVFWRVAVKPGMPVYFGTLTGVTGAQRRRAGSRAPVLFFGLPGNPVSALVSWHQFVRPALMRLLGCRDPKGQSMPARLAQSLHKKAGRLEWVRGVLRRHPDEGQFLATPCRGQQSHMLGALAAADCLIEFPADRTRLKARERILADLLCW